MTNLSTYQVQGSIPPVAPQTWRTTKRAFLVCASAERAIAMMKELYAGIEVHNVQHLGCLDAVDGATQLIDALREAWTDVPSEGRVPSGMSWVHPLIQATSAIVDPDGQYGQTPDALKRGKVATYKDRLAWAIEHANMADRVGSDVARDSYKAEALRIIQDCKAELNVDLMPVPQTVAVPRTKTGEQQKVPG